MDAVLIRAAFLSARVKMILVIAMKKVICIVEDEKDLNELVKRYLEKEGYEVRW